MFRPENIEIEAYSEEKTGVTLGLSQGIKLLHKPTGIVIIVNRHRSMHKNKEEALRILQSQLHV